MIGLFSIASQWISHCHQSGKHALRKYQEHGSCPEKLVRYRVFSILDGGMGKTILYHAF